jgi:Holliday junction resolvase
VSAPYRRGADFERRVEKYLAEKGYFVLRSAGSKSPVDLYASRGDAHFYVQCKGGQRSMPRKDRVELVELAADHRAVPVLVERGMRFFVGSEEVLGRRAA